MHIPQFFLFWPQPKTLTNIYLEYIDRVIISQQFVYGFFGSICVSINVSTVK